MSDKPVVWVGTPFILNFDDPMEIFQPLVDEGLEVRLDECRGYMPEEDVIASLPDVTAVIAGAEPYTPKVMEGAPALRIIARAGVGVNNVDIPAATERGILVANAAGQNSQSVAEHLFGLMLCACRRIGWLDVNIRKGLWREIQPPVRPLNGMTMGILGFGNIGKQVAKRAVAFDMKVIAHDIVQDEETANELGVRFVSLEELARESDYLTCHVPLTPETTHIINREDFKPHEARRLRLQHLARARIRYRRGGGRPSRAASSGAQASTCSPRSRPITRIPSSGWRTPCSPPTSAAGARMRFATPCTTRPSAFSRTLRARGRPRS